MINKTLFAESFKTILERSSLWKNEHLIVYIIMNPVAGGFTQKNKAKYNTKVISDFVDKCKNLKKQASSVTVNIYETEYELHARKITEKLLADIECFKNKNTDAENFDNSKTSWLFITAGGDGTSLDVQTSLVKVSLLSEKMKKLIQDKITVLRLPLGTGNDGSDGHNLNETLTYLAQSTSFNTQRAVKMTISNDTIEPWYAFNIASIGIDAYVTHMTNKIKKIFAANVYKIWVNLSVLFYHLQYPAKKINVKIYDEKNKLIQELNEALDFCLLGESGHRCYGSGHKILPDDRNFCCLPHLSLFGKLKHMQSFNDGSHISKGKTISLSASRLVITSPVKVLAQLDGETHLLQPEDFPIEISLTTPVIRTIYIKKENKV